MDPTSDETAGFTAFVDTHGRSLFRTAFLLTGSHVDAEELVQDTLAHLYPKWFRVQGSDSPVSYVRRALTNRFVSGKRRASSNDVPMWELPDRADGVDIASSVANSSAVWRLLGTLPDRQRAALVLRYFHDEPDEQIAVHLNCRLSTVRSLARRGLAAMRSHASGDSHASDSTDDLVWGLS